jgi:Ca-activated chloride channel family protein
MKLSGQFIAKNYCFNKDHTTHLMVSAEAPKIELDKERKPISVIAVMDKSTSMWSDNKMEYAKKSVMKFVDHLTPQDSLAVISYDSHANTLSPLTLMTQDAKDSIKSKVSKITPSAATNFSAAFLETFKLVNTLDAQVKVIFFTDGEPTVGETNEDRLCGLLKQRPENVQVSFFGYGEHHNSEFLVELAKIAKGNYAYIKNPDDALSAFAKELGGLLSCHGNNLKFRILPKNLVKINSILSDVDSKELDGGAVEISVDDIYSEEVRNLVFEVELRKQDSVLPRPVTALEVELTYTDMLNVEHRESCKVKVELVKEKDVSTDQNQDVVDQVGLAKVMQAQEIAEHQFKVGDTQGAMATMDCMVTDIADMGTGADIRLYATNASTDFTSDAAFTNSSHKRSAGKMSYMKGRSSDRDSQMVYATNSVQDAMVSSFSVEDGTNLPESKVKVEKEKVKEKSLDRTRSSNQW